MVEITRKGKNDRLEWLDAAKGAGILLVVVAHVWTSGVVRDAIYAFHMPLFFIVSGYMSRPRRMKQFLLMQWRGVVIPYCMFLASLAALDPLIEHARGHLPMFRTWDAAAKALLLGGSELRGPLTIFWFIPCLMFARIIQNALILHLPDARDWRWFAIMPVVTIFGIWIGGVTNFSPLGLLSVPIALIFLWLGALWRSIDDDRWLMPAAVIVSLGLVLFASLPPLNMKAGDYGSGAWSLAGAAILSAGLCAIARLAPLRALQQLGRMSLVIMYCHVAVIHYCAPYFAKPILLMLAIAVPIIINLFLYGTVFGQRYFLGKHTEVAAKPL